MKVIYKKKFLWALFLKVFLSFLFSSQYSRELFFPFINSISFENLNPWQSYYEKGMIDSFPYHGLMLFLLTPFVFLGEIFGAGEFFMKIPLCIADVCILIILIKLLPNNENKIFFYYFFNPVIIYATYIHSQLDIIPTALLFGSIYFLTIKKLNLSSIFFGLALATKTHILIALPLLFFYLNKKIPLFEVVKYFALSLLIVLFFDSPFIFSEGFFYTVIVNSKQSLLFDSFYSIGSLNLLFPIAIIILVYLHLFSQNKVNDDLMFFYFGILFISLIFFIYPAPAWYIWMIPFTSIYFIKNQNQNKAIFLYCLFSLSYIVFFIFFYQSEYKDIYFLGQEIDLKLRNENLRNTSYTVLKVSLVTIMHSFYVYGINSNSIYKKQKNLCVGISGDSGAGKSRLLLGLKNVLGQKLLTIEGDGDHKWERGSSKWKEFTHLDPKANNIHKQADAINLLKKNQTISRSNYDHVTGKFTKPELVEPKEFIAISGLHTFYLPKLRKIMDFKIYLETDEILRTHWKILRDTSKRGYTNEKIIEQLKNRYNDSKKYIYPQKNFADLVLNFFPIESFSPGKKDANINIGLKIEVNASIYLENLVESLKSNSISWDYNDDLNFQYITLKEPPLNNFKTLAFNTIENLNEIVDVNAKWAKGYDGFIDYLCLKIISEKLKED